MQCMLDTDTCVYLIKKAPGLKPQSALQDCYISAIVLGELEYGVANSAEARREQNRQGAAGIQFRYVHHGVRGQLCHRQSQTMVRDDQRREETLYRQSSMGLRLGLGVVQAE